MTAAGAEAVCFEIPGCHHAESDRSLYARVSRRDKGRPMCLTRFAALVSLLLSCAVLLLNAYHHKAADYQYQDGDLIVLKDGMYKVYLQITFRRPGHFVCSEEDSVFILTQKVILFAKSYQKNRDLLTASDTVDCIPKSNDCQPPGSEGSGTQYWEKSPCTSGVFALKAGDRLRVRLGDRYHELMLLQEDRTFFGAHLI
ncbi:unnamed protein product [Coregonus sp. 'balchen']|nr:unnamed protein product [Coregonus sp. 'balchen']